MKDQLNTSNYHMFDIFEVNKLPAILDTDAVSFDRTDVPAKHYVIGFMGVASCMDLYINLHGSRHDRAQYPAPGER